MYILRKKIIFGNLVCLALSQLVVQSSQAQPNAAGVFGLIGGMIAAAQMQAAKEAWTNLPELRLYCAQKALARHNVTVPALIQNGVMPTDPRLAPIGNECSRFEPGNLKSNYKCNALDENGATVVSTCNQSFGQVDGAGIAQVIDARTAIDLYFSNGSFLLVDVETDAGRQKRYREAERQRLVGDLTALRGSVESLQSSRSDNVRVEAQKLVKRIASASGPKANVSVGDVEAIRRDYRALAGFAANENSRFVALDDLDKARSTAEQRLSSEIPPEIREDFTVLQTKYAEVTQEPAPIFTLEREQLAVGPTFDCAKVKDPLGKIICSDKELSRLDVDLLRPYYVLRFSAPDQRNTLKQEAVAFTQSVLQTCAIPEKGTVSNAAAKKAIPCVAAEYRRQRDQWQAQMAQSAPYSAREETGRPLDEHVQLQKLLQEIGYIPAAEKPDGIYGAGTRTAISNFQAAENIAADGLLSDETAQRLLQRSGQSNPGDGGLTARLSDLANRYADLTRRVDRYTAQQARKRELLGKVAEAEIYAKEKSALPLPPKVSGALASLMESVERVRAAPEIDALELFVASYKTIKETTDDALTIVNATTAANRFVIEGGQNDIVVLYNDSGKAPSLVRNLKGDLVFQGGRSSLCQPHGGAPEKSFVKLANERLASTGQQLALPLARCNSGDLGRYDLIVVTRGLLQQSDYPYDTAAVLKAIDGGQFKAMFSISDQDVNAVLQAEAARVSEIEKGVEDGSLKGHGFVVLKNDSVDVCVAAAESEREVHELLLKPHMSRLTEELKTAPSIKFTSIEDAFIAAKRGQCGAVYASGNDLKTLTGALRRDQVAFRYLPVLDEPEQIAKAREQIQANVNAREQQKTAASQPSVSASASASANASASASVASAGNAASGAGVSGAAAMEPSSSESEIPQDQYGKLCRTASKVEFEVKCKGKRIVWTGSVAGNYSTDYGGSLRVQVGDSGFDLLMPRPQIDPEDLYVKGKGAEIVFSGVIAKSNAVNDDISGVKIIAVNKTAQVAYEQAEQKKREQMAKDNTLIEECKPLLRAFLFNGNRSEKSAFENDMEVRRTSKGDYIVGTFTDLYELARTENLWGEDMLNAPISMRLKYFYSAGCIVKPDGSLKPYKHKGLFDIHLHTY